MMLVTFHIVAKCVVSALIQNRGHYTNLRGHTNMHITLCHKGQISTYVHTASYSMRTGDISRRSTVQWLRRLVAGFSPQRLTFDPGPVHVEHKCHRQEDGSFCPEYFGFHLRVSFRQLSTLNLHAALTGTAGEGREPSERNALSLLGTAG